MMAQSYQAFLASYQGHDRECPESHYATLTDVCLNCGELVAPDAQECSYCHVSSCCMGEPECDTDGWHGPWHESMACMCEALNEQRRIDEMERRQSW